MKTNGGILNHVSRIRNERWLKSLGLNVVYPYVKQTGIDLSGNIRFFWVNVNTGNTFRVDGKRGWITPMPAPSLGMN